MRRLCARYGMLLVIIALMAAAMAVFIYHMFDKSSRIQVDCRGYKVDVDVIKRWEEQEKDGYLGLTGMTGWRVDDQDTVESVSTGRSQSTKVIGVYGPMDMVYDVNIISGNYGLAAEDGYCVLSVGLADALFGGTDTAGERVRFGGHILTVAGVIDKKGNYLLRPIKEGRVEQMELEFKNGLNVDDKVKQLLEGI